MPSPSNPQVVGLDPIPSGTRAAVHLRLGTAKKVTVVLKNSGLKVEFIVLPGQAFWLTPDDRNPVDIVLDDIEHDGALGIVPSADGNPGSD